jgi:hypothetical protein
MMASDDGSDEASGAPLNTSDNKKKAKKNTSAAANTDTDTEEKEGFMDKVSRSVSNCCASTGLCCFKMKEQSQISALEFKITNRQKKFGVDYLNLVQRQEPPSSLKECLRHALNDISVLQNQTNEHYDNISSKEEEVNGNIKPDPDKKSKYKDTKKADKQEEEDEDEDDDEDVYEQPESTPEESKAESKTEEADPPKKKSTKKKKKPAPKPDEDADFSIDKE